MALRKALAVQQSWQVVHVRRRQGQAVQHWFVSLRNFRGIQHPELCVCVYMYICMCVHVRDIYLFICMYVCMYMFAYVYVYVYVYVHVCVRVCVFMYVCAYVCMQCNIVLY